MNRHDRAQWASARDLAHLGALTALWLEGELGECPGYCGPPDDETRWLVPVLAACNRAGFLTDGSQPGYDCGGDKWVQRAAVEGFAAAPLAIELCERALDAGLLAYARIAPWWRNRHSTAYPVSACDGRYVTSFGTTLSARYLRWQFSQCHRAAQAAVCGAIQVTLIDPQWGRNDRLWPALAAITEQVG
jgi:hypothetical protein